jgi:glycerol-3-phosphate dehydrogenase
LKRSVETLLHHRFDVIIVGGGIYGACLAWEATSRGLSVALVEKGDFGWATSANIQRILHGGFRYMRYADVKSIRESVRERNVMMRLAPHLTDPMPFLVPTYRRGVQHREVMRAALKLYDVLSYDRNRGIEEGRQIPRGRIISREECLRLAPGLDPKSVTGGAVWYEWRHPRSASTGPRVCPDSNRGRGVRCKLRRDHGICP